MTTRRTGSIPRAADLLETDGPLFDRGGQEVRITRAQALAWLGLPEDPAATLAALEARIAALEAP